VILTYVTPAQLFGEWRIAIVVRESSARHVTIVVNFIIIFPFRLEVEKEGGRIKSIY